MRPEINAAAEFLSRIFLAHDSVSRDKVTEFKQHLSGVLEERFRDHWHESCPTKGQAYRCIRICPDESLDPILEKVCNDVGINVGDFKLPMELTLWVDPTEVVCKFGDLKCSYHTVAKKDQTSGNLDNQTGNLDIEDLVENARDLYLKKQTVIIHPIHSTEMHIQNSYADGSPNGFTMAVRMNSSMHYMSSSPPAGYDGSPRGKGKPGHTAHHKRAGYHYYGKSSGGKGTFVSNNTINAGTHVVAGSHQGGYQQHRNSGHQHHQHHAGSNHHQHHGNPGCSYVNGYLNGYQEENGFGYDHGSVSPTKANGVGGGNMPSMSGSGGPPVQISQSSPTPEQIQQQMQHPPPMPPHLQQAFSPHPPSDPSILPPPPPQPQQPLPSSSTAITTASSSTPNSNMSGSGKTNSNSNGSKFQANRGNSAGSRTRQSPVKDMK